MPAPFEITDLPGGGRLATNGATRLQVLEPGGALFRRRAIKRAPGAEPQQIEWAVAEVRGLRVYFDGTDVIVTDKDLMP